MEKIDVDRITAMKKLERIAKKAKKIINGTYDNEKIGDTLINVYNSGIDYINDFDDYSSSNSVDTKMDEIIEDQYNEYGFDDVDDMVDLAKEGVSAYSVDDWRFDAQVEILAGCKNVKDHGGAYIDFTNGNSSGDGEVEPIDPEKAVEWLDDLLDVITDYLKKEGAFNE